VIPFVGQDVRRPMHPRVAQADRRPQRGRLFEPALEEAPQAL
jgi:hypothetical protein